MTKAEADLRTLTVGEIAGTLPGATAVFRKYNIEFYRNGNEQLSNEASRSSSDIDQIGLELEALRVASPCVPSEAIELVSYIQERYHDALRREFPELIQLAKRVEQTHAKHPKVPTGLSRLLEAMSREFERHLQKEEQIVFPRILRGEADSLKAAILLMRQEHEHNGVRARIIDTLTGHLTLPRDACTTWRALYVGLEKLLADMREHIDLEDNVLFPPFVA